MLGQASDYPLFLEELTALFLCGMPTLQLFGVEVTRREKWWGGPDLNQRPSSVPSMKLNTVLGVSETS